MWGRFSWAVGLATSAVAVSLLAWLPTGARADAPALTGAATHPLWSNASVATSDRELDLLKDAGANSVRIDLGWSTLEQDGEGTRSQWYVDKADTFFAHARARGLKVIVTFLGSPCWASSAPADVKQGCAGAWWERGVDLYPPTDPADYADAAAWVAQRWGADIAALEVWNEPNYPYFFRSPNPAADYAGLLKATYPRVKQVAPGLPVLGAALLGSDVPFLEQLYAAGIQPVTDGISLHPYNTGADPRDTAPLPNGVRYSFLRGVPAVRGAMVAHGDADKKVWITELGWSSCGPGGTSTWCVTPATQARYVGDALRVVRDCWDYVQAVNIYTLRNTGTDPNDRESQMGLVFGDFALKPSYSAFADALAEMRADPGAPPPGAGTPACGATAPAPPSNPQPPAAERAPAPSSLQGPAAAPRRRDAAPTVRGLALRPAALRRGRRTRVSWRLSAPARASFSIERLRRTRRTWVRVPGSFRRSGNAGRHSLVFAGRIAGRQLAAGRYRLVVVARDRTGNRSRPARTTFRILP